jgi:hypothetical protein
MASYTESQWHRRWPHLMSSRSLMISRRREAGRTGGERQAQTDSRPGADQAAGWGLIMQSTSRVRCCVTARRVPVAEVERKRSWGVFGSGGIVLSICVVGGCGNSRRSCR